MLVRAIILNNTEEDISLDRVRFWLFSAPGNTNIVNENEKKGGEYKFDIANFESFPMILTPKKQSLIFYTRSFNRQILRENKINSEAIGTWKFQLYLEANGQTFKGEEHVIEIISKERMDEILMLQDKENFKNSISDVTHYLLFIFSFLTVITQRSIFLNLFRIPYLSKLKPRITKFYDRYERNIWFGRIKMLSAILLVILALLYLLGVKKITDYIFEMFYKIKK